MSKISDQIDKFLLNYSYLFWGHFSLGHSVYMDLLHQSFTYRYFQLWMAAVMQVWHHYSYQFDNQKVYFWLWESNFTIQRF